MLRISRIVSVIAAVGFVFTSLSVPASADVTNGAVFPVQKGTYHYSDTWRAARSNGRLHNGTDIMAKQMSEVYAMVDGTIAKAKNEGIHVGSPSSSYYLLLNGDDGRSYFYVHLNNDTPGRPRGCDHIGGMENAFAPKLIDHYRKHGTITGARVKKGDLIGWVGSSGNATCRAPHLHLEIWPAHGWGAQKSAYNPYSILRAIEAGTNPFPTAPSPVPTAPKPPAKPVVPPMNENVQRIAASDRVGTAAKMSQNVFLQADTAVVVPSETYREALIGAPLAAAHRGPVLLTNSGNLNPVTAAELQRLGVKKVYTVGNVNVRAGLNAIGITDIQEFRNDDPAELAYQVATQIAKVAVADDSGDGDGAFTSLQNTQVVITSADDSSWPDALSSSVLASHSIAPVLFSYRDSVPASTLRALDTLNPGHIFVIGGSSKIGPAAREIIQTKAFVMHEIGGATRIDTALNVAKYLYENDPDLSNNIFIATANNFPDALAAGPALAARDGLLVLADDSANMQTRNWLGNVTTSSVFAIGGQKVLSAQAINNVTANIK